MPKNLVKNLKEYVTIRSDKMICPAIKCLPNSSTICLSSNTIFCHFLISPLV